MPNLSEAPSVLEVIRALNEIESVLHRIGKLIGQMKAREMLQPLREELTQAREGITRQTKKLENINKDMNYHVPEQMNNILNKRIDGLTQTAANLDDALDKKQKQFAAPTLQKK